MAQPIRVLHVLQRMEAGGSQAFLMNLYRHIDRSKVQFDFLVEYTERQFYDDEIEELGGKIYRCSFREDLNLPRFIRFLKIFFKTHREYEIVHCHAYTIGFLVLKAAAQAGVRVRIAHSHSNKMTGVTVPLKLLMRALFPMYATDLMAASKEAGVFLFGKRDFAVINNAIDIDLYRFNQQEREAIRSELGLGDSFVIGNVGRLHQQKNQLFLLDVFKAVLDVQPDARLLIVGSGPLYGQLIDKAKRLGIERKTVFLSNRHDVNKLYQAMDVFVLPSLFEGLGIVNIEAQCAGLPTICSNGVAEGADISPLFRRLSLEAGPNAWAQAIVQSRGIREPNLGPLGAWEHGFDVKRNSAMLQEWYMKKARHE